MEQSAIYRACGTGGEIAHIEKKYGERIDLSAYTSVILTANQDKLGKEDFEMITPRTQKILEEIGWAEK